MVNKIIPIIAFLISCQSIHIIKNKMENINDTGKLILRYHCIDCSDKIFINFSLAKTAFEIDKKYLSQSLNYENAKTVLSYEGIFENQFEFEIPPGDYYSLLYNYDLVLHDNIGSRLLGNVIPFIYQGTPLNIIFGVDLANNEVKGDNKCISDYYKGGILQKMASIEKYKINICKKIVINSKKDTIVTITRKGSKFRAKESFFQWIPGILWLAPLFGGFIFEIDYEVNVENY